MRLLNVEMRRFMARRLTKIVIVIALAGIIAAGVTVFFKSTKSAPGPIEVSGARAAATEACIRGETEPPGAFEGKPGAPQVVPPTPVVPPQPGTPQRAQYCRDGFANVDLSFFGEPNDKRFHLAEVDNVFEALSPWFAIIAWVMAASFIGAEWRAGTVTTLLTWEPRRIRLLLAKAAAAILLGGVIVMVLEGLLTGALLPSAFYRGTTAGVNAEFWRHLAYLDLRIIALSTIAAALGFSVGMLGRNTAAALGAGFVYLAVIEGGLLGGLIPKIRPWLIVGNSIVFISGQKGDIAGRTPLQAGLLLGGYGAAFIVVATAFFRRRDVT